MSTASPLLNTETILERLRNSIIAKTGDTDSDIFRLRGAWLMNLLFQPNSAERIFSYDVCIVQAQGQGCCYMSENTFKPNKQLLGVDTRFHVSDNQSLSIALLDAAYSCIPSKPSLLHTLRGNSETKAYQRAEIIVDEVEHYCLSNNLTGCRVGVVGTIGNVVGSLVRRGCLVRATDLDSDLIGRQTHGVSVENGAERTLDVIRNVEVAVVTGMTLATNTLGNIITAARKSATRIILVAETGAWFAPEYCNTFGVDSVVAEPFPFYIFSGTSTIHLYRKRC